jgi:hypothetical protein
MFIGKVCFWPWYKYRNSKTGLYLATGPRLCLSPLTNKDNFIVPIFVIGPQRTSYNPYI